MSEDDGKMSFLEHLEELRVRLIRCAVAVLAGMIVCWFFREEIRAFLEAPLYEAWRSVEGLPEPRPLNFAGLLEPFVAYLKLSAVGGIFLASPVVLHQIWRFVSPGLYRRERKMALPFVLVSTVLFVGGSIMAYAVVFPIGFRFFLDFAVGAEVDTLEAEIAIVPADMDGPAPAPISETRPDAGTKDAGTEDRTDAGTKDAGADAGADAGTDAGTEDGAGGEAAHAPVEGSSGTGEAEAQEDEPEARAWYEPILEAILRSGCGDLSAAAGEDGGAVLSLGWEEARCGRPPRPVETRRDGEAIDVSWEAQPGPAEGIAILTAADPSAGDGAHAWEVDLVREGGAGQLAPVLMVKDYLSFAVRLLLAFGLIFELPILVSFLSIAGIVNYRQLLRFSRWFLVIAVVVGAMLTPPDVVTQLLLATPLVILYFLSIGVAYVFGPTPRDD